ncbi:MAG: hypothetical protein L0H53_14850 [Candidatus Nitrosocosmicus sp.]|nr:hypothetical protein [Candidatus Nitrosocosmicus sp.]MDN5868680.1 hypothetical protein [Candidatus Nitrosocosmicus sp.]
MFWLDNPESTDRANIMNHDESLNQHHPAAISSQRAESILNAKINKSRAYFFDTDSYIDSKHT